MKFRRLRRIFSKVFVEYCRRCSLAGFRYIAGRKYHFTERLFWLGCVVLTWAGSYYLITNNINTFHKNGVSLVIENVLAHEKTELPSFGICEIGYAKDYYDSLENMVNNMRKGDMDYNYDVEDFMLRIVYVNLYNVGAIVSYCRPYRNCANCIKCPLKGYNKLAAQVRANCSQLFDGCSWNGIKFDCCRYFLPMQTSMGSCFLLNSVQLTEKGGKNWLNMEVVRGTASGELLLNITKASSAYIMNEEDIPHMLLTTLQFNQIPEGYAGTVYFAIQNIVNDPLVRTVDPELRRCIFPDEISYPNYQKYSYSVCVTECLKMAQIKMCNCCHHNLVTEDDILSPICEYDGLSCLDQKDLMFPQTSIMQPWRTNGLVCQCLPSCNEHEIRVIGKQSEIEERNSRSVLFKLVALPSQRYRRQIVRENLDIVVSIGGILGLFMGASILSLVELVYFFTVRFVSASYLENQEDEEEEDYDDVDEDVEENENTKI